MTTALEKYESEGRDVLGMVQMLAVDSKERYVAAADVLVDIKTIRKNIAAEREKVVKPQRDALEATRELFKRIDSRYEAAETELKRRLAQYTDDALVEEARLLAEAAQSETHALALVSEAAPVAPGVQTRTKRCFKVFDPLLVPNHFKCVDEKAIGKAVRDGLSELPGVRIWEETIIAAGTR